MTTTLTEALDQVARHLDGLVECAEQSYVEKDQQVAYMTVKAGLAMTALNDARRMVG